MPEPVEFVPLERGRDPSTDLDGVTLYGVYSVEEGGGMQAPEKKVESGYTWKTRVGAEPVGITLRAWMTAAEYDNLSVLRDSREPLAFSMNGESLDVAIDDLSPTVEGEAPGAYDVTIDLRQIQQATVGTSGIRALPITGIQSGGGSGSPPRVRTTRPSTR